MIYNNFNKVIPEMYDTLVILNLHHIIWDSYIHIIMSGHLVVEDRGIYAETHLALARSQNTGTGILGHIFTKDKRQRKLPFFAGR